MKTYDCGCTSDNGILRERCAWARAKRDEIELFQDARKPDRDRLTQLAAELSGHYPSKFAAPGPTGPIS